MSSAIFNSLEAYGAEQFKRSVSGTNPDTNLYFTFGRTEAWANDSLPDTANTSVQSQYDIWKNMIGGKRVVGGDIQLGVRRINWQNNTPYVAYDHERSDLFSDNVNFYVLTDTYNVYKCISNNYGANSVVKPTSVNPQIVSQTADGYVWKYMFTLNDSDIVKFTTQEYFPVRTLTEDDGSLQWQVQENAEEGAIYSIILTNNGSGYTNANSVVVSITGDGTGATATATVNTVTNTVTNIVITNYGSGYTRATANVSGGNGSGAQTKVIISPPGGHGSNPTHELGSKTAIVNIKLKGSEDGEFPTFNDYRQVALIRNPYLKNTTKLASNAHFLQTYTIYTTGVGNYARDEIVYQGLSLAESVFSGRVFDWDSANNKLLLINTSGTPLSQSIIGANTFTSRFVIGDPAPVPGDFKPYSGEIIYMNNIKPITRNADQTEDFKIVLNF